MQLGLAPDAPVLDGISSADLVVLRHLDGTHSRAALVALAGHHGLSADRGDELIALLEAHGVLSDDAPRRLATWRRDHARVVVVGHSPMAAASARALGQAEVCAVIAAHGTADEVLTLAAHDQSHTGADRRLAVIVGAGSPDTALSDALREAGFSHLPVVGAGDRVTVGPLVASTRSPVVCVRCVELHRADLDPFWPTVVDQSTSSPAAAAAAFSAGVTPLAIAVTVMVSLSHLEGISLPSGVTLDLSAPWPRIDYRQWPAHPSCRCQPARAAGPTGILPHHDGSLRETMAQ